DISAAARDLGYRPRVTLEDGIRTYLAWLKRQEASK
ncbi:3-beta hydroxysteroid dehydrogenase, partial [Escherichia coli]|nr:3-beta hydroxysteroid dehydrogenase [Escherichia coli]